MRRLAVLVSVIAVALVGLVALGSRSIAIAQDATPAAGMAAEGITFEPVAFAVGVAAPDPADLFVVRLGLDPGATLPIEASDPTAGMLVVEAGTFTVRVEGPVTVTRGAGLQAALATAEATGDLGAVNETVAAGQEVTLAAGDAAYIPGSVAGEIRNDGQERAVGLAFLLGPATGPMAEATPAG